MLFSRLALVSLLGVAVSALSQPPSLNEKRLSVDANVHVSTSDILEPLHHCVSKVKSLGAEIAEVVDTVNKKDATAVVAAVGPLLVVRLAVPSINSLLNPRLSFLSAGGQDRHPRHGPQGS